MGQEPGGSPTKKRRYEYSPEVQQDGKLERGTSLMSSQVEENSPQSPKTINASGTYQEVNCINMQTCSMSNINNEVKKAGKEVQKAGNKVHCPK